MKYTKEYIASNKITIHTKTKEEFGIVTRKLKISSVLRDHCWNGYKENTGVLFYDGKLGSPCYTNIKDKAYLLDLNLLTFEEFCLGNNIFIEQQYEIY